MVCFPIKADLRETKIPGLSDRPNLHWVPGDQYRKIKVAGMILTTPIKIWGRGRGIESWVERKIRECHMHVVRWHWVISQSPSLSPRTGTSTGHIEWCLKKSRIIQKQCSLWDTLQLFIFVYTNVGLVPYFQYTCRHFCWALSVLVLHDGIDFLWNPVQPPIGNFRSRRRSLRSIETNWLKAIRMISFSLIRWDLDCIL